MVAPTTRLRLTVAPGGGARVRRRLVSGGASRNKIVELTGLAPDEIERRLATAGTKESE